MYFARGDYSQTKLTHVSYIFPPTFPRSVLKLGVTDLAPYTPGCILVEVLVVWDTVFHVVTRESGLKERENVSRELSFNYVSIRGVWMGGAESLIELWRRSVVGVWWQRVGEEGIGLLGHRHDGGLLAFSYAGSKEMLDGRWRRVDVRLRGRQSSDYLTFTQGTDAET